MKNPSPPENSPETHKNRSSHAHWHENLRLMGILLFIWFVVSYLLGILFVEPLNQFYFGGFPVGFWFAQQGSIYVFIMLTFVYAFVMDRIDQRHGVESGSPSNLSNPSSQTPK